LADFLSTATTSAWQALSDNMYQHTPVTPRQNIVAKAGAEIRYTACIHFSGTPYIVRKAPATFSPPFLVYSNLNDTFDSRDLSE
jgi:hypothetical protein